ncbi:5-formyltetrahydrofolate cyclo-ligase [Parasphingorhabdus halotolerans]|uniref:5-formyltetrahydrofolate cyclo-ligase n=1 Tax=Parasphingorhabdus halotolerans TaxID=2725558 RepID=A0A6H2DJE3_9SPHN|nr:5-formyltetrahydrofolate cyclo-ligase [Parasphingorhabdus halotolerans]QJB68065.1 5-formyltetrahydrofolate cyclo-ligase [Parasphingorhabdus halotolerans]
MVPSLLIKKDNFLSSLSENKKKLRKEYQRKRNAFVGQLDAATRNLAFRRPPSPLMRLIEQSEIIALYHSIGSEAPTTKLTEYLLEIGKIICFPIVQGNTSLDFRVVSNMELFENGFRDIPEPTQDNPTAKPDLIIAPMVAFDRSLMRLGQGGGHYDRTFEKYPDAARIGMAWSVQECTNIPVEAHDVPLQMIITECEIIQ